ncbi:M24 family metallopeptidase [Corynebacterium bovis]|uniref:D-alanyl-D-alanine dipeptidase n=1 Tax=Corynebacterium bovis DSM 20582 = CIP 54.80 TaxID=927655 RepID=A0A8H9Y5R0_9CORY|nr:Xaa-Pro peptidase family protein [Corynebacterium bovis]MBB3115219.1 D-alanyl-D-alanine dipeptidase [Corynebacterium bovis DSM 20582 = CIP 54.80]QQC47833.1 aminopeptidase P family protein [Corynebacterium bovis]RRO79549.1 aminopeptidase P family protein [Corynebacterium bovis]RRO80852.1 aminopeptidase P family protein [Corynebacterium bovis]RRO82246.1 aminopeptidase P family protein [Corynebacterium bovis]
MSERSSIFPPETFRSRLDRVADLVESRGLDGALITPGPDLEYLLDSRIATHERFAGLVVTPGRRVMVVPAVDAADMRSSVAGAIGVDVVGWSDGEDPYALVPAGDVAVSASTTADHLTLLMDRGLRPVNATTVLRDVFMRKEEAEIGELRRAAHAIDEVHRQVPAILRAGVTENEVAAELEALILAEHRSVDFIIVGSGPHGADPHHDHSDRVIRDGDVVVVDIGGTLDTGYHSDCTRTYVVGEPDDRQREMYAVLQAAQQRGLDVARPGVTAQEVDRAVRQVIDEAGYGEYVIHRTGHGIGLSGHEEPFIIEGNDLVLEESMAFSVEPGLYVPGSWGARIEDIIVLTADGHEQLNVTTHDLVHVPAEGGAATGAGR